MKVSWKMLVLEAWGFTFGEGLMENARFGTLEFHFGESLVVSSKSVLSRVSSKSV